MPAWDFEKIRALILTDDDEGYVSDKEAGERLGVSERVIREVKSRGLNDYEADYFAVKAGTLPMVVFRGWADVDEETLDRQAREAEAGFRLGDRIQFVMKGETVTGVLDGFPASHDAVYVRYEGSRVYVRKAEATMRRRRRANV